MEILAGITATLIALVGFHFIRWAFRGAKSIEWTRKKLVVVAVLTLLMLPLPYVVSRYPDAGVILLLVVLFGGPSLLLVLQVTRRLTKRSGGHMKSFRMYIHKPPEAD